MPLSSYSSINLLVNYTTISEFSNHYHLPFNYNLKNSRSKKKTEMMHFHLLEHQHLTRPGYWDWWRKLNQLCASGGPSISTSPAKDNLISVAVEGQYRPSKKVILIYLINSDIVDMDSWILHSNRNDVIILRMECKEGWSRRWWHERCHYLKRAAAINGQQYRIPMENLNDFIGNIPWKSSC